MTKKRPQPPKAPAPGKRFPGQPLTPEIEAQVWVLTEEHMSWRQIKQELGVGFDTISRILSRDPARLGALRSAQRQERSKLWQQIENQGLLTVSRMVAAAGKALFDDKGNPRKNRTKADTAFLEDAARWLAPIRHAAHSATQMTQLLTGGATERNGQADAPAGLETELTEDQIIQAFIDDGIVDQLPPAMRAKALLRAKADPVRK